ncbi:MAG: ABC transporter ATP-binding protein [Candidatus Berkelbacteria bacterium]|nr:ABC transporter ATP-binding protein [Candidatus Berkelbacteria bacterium]
MKKNIIECKDITKTYINGDISTTVLNKVTFSIEEGEFVAIVGPSGSGKSTLMHIVGALDSPTSGQYRLDGSDVSRLSEDELAEVRGTKIGFVFQSFNLLPRATVMRNVQLPLLYANVPVEKRDSLALKVLESAGMDKERYYNRSNQLSGGQMQRVAIARALINNPSIILADEPTGNLDQKTGRVVLETFQKLNNEGKTVILITHDQYVAEHANRIIQIRDGEITEDAKTTRKHLRALEGRVG